MQSGAPAKEIDKAGTPKSSKMFSFNPAGYFIFLFYYRVSQPCHGATNHARRDGKKR
jgi:hypothetical protein